MVVRCRTWSRPSGALALAADEFVIDGSAAVNAVLVEGAFVAWPDVRLIAPTLLWSEAASALSQLRWRGAISDDQLRVALERLLASRITPVPSVELVAEAAALARELGWAKTYDAEYVVLARRLGSPLMTVDARLAATVRGRVEVVSPADVDPS